MRAVLGNEFEEGPFFKRVFLNNSRIIFLREIQLKSGRSSASEAFKCVYEAAQLVVSVHSGELVHFLESDRACKAGSAALDGERV